MKLVPSSTASEHIVEDQKELSHAGGQCHLVGLSRIHQTLVKGPDDRVEANGNGGSHVQHLTHMRSATPDSASAPEGAAVPIQRGNSDEGSDLIAIQSAQLREVSQKGSRGYWTYTFDTVQKLVFIFVDRAFSNGLLQFLVDVIQLLLKPIDMGLDPLLHPLIGSAETVLLGSEHLDDLTPASQYGTKLFGLLVWRSFPR